MSLGSSLAAEPGKQSCHTCCQPPFPASHLPASPPAPHRFDRNPEPTQALSLPAGTTAAAALDRVLRLPGVGSKRFLTTKVDRSVTGLIAQQQCCGPLQLPVSDVAVMAQAHLGGYTGSATAIGEQPLKVRACSYAAGEWRRVVPARPAGRVGRHRGVGSFTDELWGTVPANSVRVAHHPIRHLSCPNAATCSSSILPPTFHLFPRQGLIDPKAMARLALGEALTNLVFARCTALRDIKASGGWMGGWVGRCLACWEHLPLRHPVRCHSSDASLFRCPPPCSQLDVCCQDGQRGRSHVRRRGGPARRHD